MSRPGRMASGGSANGTDDLAAPGPRRLTRAPTRPAPRRRSARRAERELGVELLGARRQAARVADDDRVLAQLDRRPAERVDDRPVPAAGAVVLSPGPLPRLVLGPVVAGGDESRCEPGQGPGNL